MTRNGERDIGETVLADVLHHHIDRDLLTRDGREDLPTHSGDIGDAQHRHAGFVGGHRGAANRLAGRFGLGDDHRALGVRETAADVNRDAKLFGKFNRAAVHHARAEAGQFKHLVVTDHVDASRFGQQPRVGGVNAIHVGIDFTRVGANTAANATAVVSLPPRPSVVMFKSSSIPWNPAATTMLPSASVPFDPLRRDRLNPGLAEAVVGLHADLAPGQANRFGTEVVDRHRNQRDADLFAGAQQHVHFASRRMLADLSGQPQQSVGVLAHGADDHHDSMPLPLGANGLPRRSANLVDVGDAGAAELLNDQRHDGVNLVVEFA